MDKEADETPFSRLLGEVAGRLHGGGCGGAITDCGETWLSLLVLMESLSVAVRLQIESLSPKEN